MPDSPYTAGKPAQGGPAIGGANYQPYVGSEAFASPTGLKQVSGSYYYQQPMAGRYVQPDKTTGYTDTYTGWGIPQQIVYGNRARATVSGSVGMFASGVPTALIVPATKWRPGPLPQRRQQDTALGRRRESQMKPVAGKRVPPLSTGG